MQLSLLLSLHDYIGDISTGVDACIMMGVLGRFLYLQMAGLVIYKWSQPSFPTHMHI